MVFVEGCLFCGLTVDVGKCRATPPGFISLDVSRKAVKRTHLGVVSIKIRLLSL